MKALCVFYGECQFLHQLTSHNYVMSMRLKLHRGGGEGRGEEEGERGERGGGGGERGGRKGRRWHLQGDRKYCTL